MVGDVIKNCVSIVRESIANQGAFSNLVAVFVSVCVRASRKN